MKILAWARRGVQLLVVAGLCVLPWLNAAELRQISGSFLRWIFSASPLLTRLARLRLRLRAFCPASACLPGP